jgi:hypothetical protein
MSQTGALYTYHINSTLRSLLALPHLIALYSYVMVCFGVYSVARQGLLCCTLRCVCSVAVFVVGVSFWLLLCGPARGLP